LIPLPTPASPLATAEPEMWQVLGLQRASVSATNIIPSTTQDEPEQNPETENPDAETRSNSPADSDNSFARITIKMEVDESKQRPIPESPEVENPESEPEEPEEEERPPTAMSILSHDSDDDPTW